MSWIRSECFCLLLEVNVLNTIKSFICWIGLLQIVFDRSRSNPLLDWRFVEDIDGSEHEVAEPRVNWKLVEVVSVMLLFKLTNIKLISFLRCNSSRNLFYVYSSYLSFYSSESDRIYEVLKIVINTNPI